jgi:hypothetical protein
MVDTLQADKFCLAFMTNAVYPGNTGAFGYPFRATQPAQFVKGLLLHTNTGIRVAIDEMSDDAIACIAQMTQLGERASRDASRISNIVEPFIHYFFIDTPARAADIFLPTLPPPN